MLQVVGNQGIWRKHHLYHPGKKYKQHENSESKIQIVG
jgi:hypothetical protein